MLKVVGKHERISYQSILIIYGSFLIFTSLSVYISYIFGDYGGDLISLGINVDSSRLFSIYFQVLLSNLIFIFIFFMVSSQSFKIGLVSSGSKHIFIHILMTIVIIFSLLVVKYTTTGNMFRDGYSNRMLDIAFALIQPFYLSLIYFYVFQGSKSMHYKFNALIYVIACLFTGFTGYLFFAVPFVLKKAVERIGWMKILCIAPFALFLMPLLHVYKFMLKYEMSIIEMYEWLDVERMLAFSRSIVDRFSYIPNLIFIEEHSTFFYDVISKPENMPIFQGYFGSLLEKVFVARSSGNVNAAVSGLLYENSSSNTTFSLLSYIHVDLSYGLVVSVYSFGLFLFLKFILDLLVVGKDNYLSYLLFAFSYLYLFQGWFWPYCNVIQAGILFVVVIIISSLVDKALVRII
ncbi:oligosaccharide repeat unit polymerase [Vibrio furnissii]|uniref:oligosaccharide repeat unit polymerase n=1 Tax=Vibrio furnissii TaxID=29494 RepID=UPI0023DB3D3E|nr:oligosaccharide repeat unit polymerase [Vibrio furnissii]